MENYSKFIIENFRNVTGISIISLFILTGLLMLYLYIKYYDGLMITDKKIKRIFYVMCMIDFIATFIAIGILIMTIVGSMFGFYCYTIAICVITVIRIKICD